jgi:hypothetical protein
MPRSAGPSRRHRRCIRAARLQANALQFIFAPVIPGPATFHHHEFSCDPCSHPTGTSGGHDSGTDRCTVGRQLEGVTRFRRASLDSGVANYGLSPAARHRADIRHRGRHNRPRTLG